MTHMKKSAFVQCVLLSAVIAGTPATAAGNAAATAGTPAAAGDFQQSGPKKDSTQHNGVVRSGFGHFFHHHGGQAGG